MSSGYSPVPRTRKRQLSSEAHPVIDSSLLPAAKRTRLEHKQIHRTPSSFGDNLSRQWLIPRALREFDRRTVWRAAPVPPGRTGKNRIHFAHLKRFARHGGPSLGNLRAYPEPGTAITSHQTMNSSQSGSRERARVEEVSSASPKTRRTSAYDDCFEQHLIDNGIYPEQPSDPEDLQEPDNLEEIQARLAMRRPSLSPSRVLREEFQIIRKANMQASTEAAVMIKVFPFIAGAADVPSQVGILFGNLKDLTDGSIFKVQPDLYDGILPAELHEQIRADLNPYIVPSTDTTNPCVPNFFAGVKPPKGRTDVCKRQALYDGALGARGIPKLRSYVDGKTSYDNNAYTITSTYDAAGTLKLYTIHPTRSTRPEMHSEYHMTYLRGWIMTDSVENFR